MTKPYLENQIIWLPITFCASPATIAEHYVKNCLNTSVCTLLCRGTFKRKIVVRAFKRVMPSEVIMEGESLEIRVGLYCFSASLHME